jgi:hypothetical protein
MGVRSDGVPARLGGYWHEGHYFLAACGVAEEADAMVAIAVDANDVRDAAEVAVYAFAVDSAGFVDAGSADGDNVGDVGGLKAAAAVGNESRLPGGSQDALDAPDGFPVLDEKTLFVQRCWTMTGEI